MKIPSSPKASPDIATIIKASSDVNWISLKDLEFVESLGSGQL
jgi:hypothetical protein